MRISLDQIELLLNKHGISAAAVAVDDRLVILHTTPDLTQEARKIVVDAYKLPMAASQAKEIPEDAIAAYWSLQDRECCETAGLARCGLSMPRQLSRTQNRWQT